MLNIDDVVDTILGYRQGIIQRDQTIQQLRDQNELLAQSLKEADSLQKATEGRCVAPAVESSGGTIVRPVKTGKS